MKTKVKVALAVLAGALIGAAAGRTIPAQQAAIHAQQAKTAPGYIMAEVEVTDPTALKEYAAKAPQIIASYGGHYVVRGGKAEALEGEAPKSFIVVLGFDSVEKARAWYDSPEYRAVRPIRQGATKSRLLLLEGVAPE